MIRLCKVAGSIIVVTIFIVYIYAFIMKIGDDHIHKNFYKHYPSGKILNWHASEGDSDNVYIEIEYIENQTTQHITFLFQKDDLSSWSLISIIQPEK